MGGAHVADDRRTGMNSQNVAPLCGLANRFVKVGLCVVSVGLATKGSQAYGEHADHTHVPSIGTIRVCHEYVFLVVGPHLHQTSVLAFCRCKQHRGGPSGVSQRRLVNTVNTVTRDEPMLRNLPECGHLISLIERPQ